MRELRRLLRIPDIKIKDFQRERGSSRNDQENLREKEGQAREKENRLSERTFALSNKDQRG